MQNVNEKSTAYLSVTFLDKNGIESSPVSISYTIHTKANVEIRGMTSVSIPASSIEIVLTPSDNAIVNLQGRSEIHIVTVIATYGASDALVSTYEYQINRIDAVS